MTSTCRRGHPKIPANIRDYGGRTRCYACILEQQRNRRRAKKAGTYQESESMTDAELEELVAKQRQNLPPWWKEESPVAAEVRIRVYHCSPTGVYTQRS